MAKVNIRPMVNKVGARLHESSPTILAGIAVGGVVYVGYQAAVDTSKAMKLLKEAEKDGPLTRADKFKLCWKCYIPTAIASAGTITAMICSNRIGAKRTAALAAACTLSEKAFRDYKEELAKVIDEKDQEKVHDILDQKHLGEVPLERGNQVIVPDGKVLCFEAYCGNYFYSNINTIRRIMNDINDELRSSMYVSLNEVYGAIGIPYNKAGEEVGFNIDHPVDFIFTSQLTEEGQPCLVVDYREGPRSDFRRII